EAASHLQRLPTVVEDRLTNWILNQEALGYGVTHTQIRLFGERLLALQGDHKPLGKNRMARFLARNPILKIMKQMYFDSVRINCARSEFNRPWFQKLEIPAIRAIPANQRWNMDETGVMEGYGLNGYVVGSVETRKIQGKQPGSRAWTTIIECISATDESTLPSVIYKTPKVRKDLYLQIRNLASGSHDQLPTQRLLFRKVIKGIDEKEYKLGKANMRIKELEERLELLRPKKKRKVQTSPNSKFTTIRAIKEAQITARERQVTPIESDSRGKSDSTISCIEVDAE
ncbi:hypothetical protein GcM3_036032, partial [Golovinomyces cichoracearum]